MPSQLLQNKLKLNQAEKRRPLLNLSKEEYLTQKFIEPEHLSNWARLVRNNGQTIATLNGSFDLLQAGHLYILFEAAKQADILIVGLNSDASIKKYKSPDRPIVELKYRMEMLAALGFVDYVTHFDETDPIAFLEKVRPDVHVNGIEYVDECIEAETILKNGGRLHFAKRIGDLSTSNIIRKIQNLCD